MHFVTRVNGVKKTAMQPGLFGLLVGTVPAGETVPVLPVLPVFPVLPVGPEGVAVLLGLGLGEGLEVIGPDGTEADDT